MPRTSLLVALLLLVSSISACGRDEEPPATTPAPEAVATPDARLDADRTHVATVSTNLGDFAITLDVATAPITTSSFAHLVEQDFYDGLTFHRVSRGFVIQGGDPLGNGSGGPGYQVTEAPPASLAYDQGVVAMAKRPDEPAGVSGSQFFVITEGFDLDPDYALLGRVTSGMETVERIAASEVANAIDPLKADFEKPTEPVVIRDITIATS